MSDQIQTASDKTLLELEANQALRQGIIDALLKDKDELVKDHKMLSVLDKFLSSSDKSALGRMKIKVDEKANDIGAQTAKLLANLLVNPAIKTIGISDTAIERDIPDLPELSFPVEILPGEMDQGVVTEDHASFMQRMVNIGNIKST